MSSPSLLTLDSITKIGLDGMGSVALAASHGGMYSAHFAARAGVVGLILCDAGVGLDKAGIGGLSCLDASGIPGAAIDYRSARIGDGQDCMRRGVISHVNTAAVGCGVEPGMLARQALRLMTTLEHKPVAQHLPMKEVRRSCSIEGAVRPVWLADSASLIVPPDEGAVMVTGSHGGLLGGMPESAVKAQVFASLYNDAGIGADEAGISRLPVLSARGIPAVTVDAYSARIGDARSSYETGVISAVNDAAASFGIRVGMSARAYVELMARIR